MARGVLVDCFSGASGDMLLGALVDAGVQIEDLCELLNTLPVAGWRLDAERITSHGLAGTRARVEVDERDRPHRGLSEVERIVISAGLPTPVADRACAVFRELAHVEATIHATSVEAVEFHEVGAVDAIVDVVGVVLGLYLLEVDWSRIVCSGVPLGSGWVRSAHGRLPVPAPATLELVRRSGLAIRPNPEPGETGELTTPTGAALLGTLCASTPNSAFERLERIGYGFGSRETAWPNALRILITTQEHEPRRDCVVEIQTNLDDATPEELAYAMERLLDAGALDVAFSPLQMKKNRPGVLVRVIGRPEDGQRLAEMVLEHTSALGVRMQRIERLIARRSERSVVTPWGDVRVKVKHLGGREFVAPEYEDCARVARDHRLPLRDVYAAARSAPPSPPRPPSS